MPLWTSWRTWSSRQSGRQPPRWLLLFLPQLLRLPSVIKVERNDIFFLETTRQLKEDDERRKKQKWRGRQNRCGRWMLPSLVWPARRRSAASPAWANRACAIASSSRWQTIITSSTFPSSVRLVLKKSKTCTAHYGEETDFLVGCHWLCVNKDEMDWNEWPHYVRLLFESDEKEQTST